LVNFNTVEKRYMEDIWTFGKCVRYIDSSL